MSIQLASDRSIIVPARSARAIKFVRFSCRIILLQVKFANDEKSTCLLSDH